jgi:hypothetical protein
MVKLSVRKGAYPMNKGYKQLVAEANAAIETVSVSEAMQQLQSGDVSFIDIRDLPELERDGKIPGAVHASRGMLEFHADPESPYFKDVFSPDRRLILYCASGGRSALAASRLQEMGFSNVAHMAGGIKAWKDASGSVETVN